MKTPRLRRFLEIGWVVICLGLVALWARSFIHARYQEQWESWLSLPWLQKLQPLELTLTRYVQRPPSVKDERGPSVSEGDLERSMHSAADWLLSVQEVSGHFKYWYDPVRNEFSPREDDSFHRQAGAAYGLILAYEMSGDERYLESARRSVDYLFCYRRTLDPDITYFFAEDQADLGGAALPMLTMIKLRELTGSSVYDADLKRLGNFVLMLQRKYGTGEFKSTYVYRGNYDVERELGWQSPISPGQALLALAWMHRNFQDPIYKNSIDRALEFYSDEKYWKQSAFLPSTLDAFASMYSTTGDAKYGGYATQLADFLISLQNLGSRDGVSGSFGSFPSIASASLLEGLGDAVRFSQESGDSAREAIYRQRALMGYVWVLALQYGPHNVAGLRSPNRTIGGFAHSPYEPQIRIDYNDHAISAFVRGLRFVFGRQPVVPSRERAEPGPQPLAGAGNLPALRVEPVADESCQPKTQ